MMGKTDWQPIETAPHGETLLLFQPAIVGSQGQRTNPERVVVDRWPTTYPRRSSHWMHVPKRPADAA